RVGSSKFLVCSTVPAVLIWATPPGLLALNNAGTEIQNEAPPFTVVCGFHTGCSKPPSGNPPRPVGIMIWLPGRGAPLRVTGGGPVLGEERISKAGGAAVLAARDWGSRGGEGSSSARIAAVGGPGAVLGCKGAAAGGA